uniref:Importin N-terminal domain-containing protein n=1 Tax=Periophthalmus magnuspinnatus TaxID=409849 RepID=A0A3B3ZCQ3_9GOBI
MDAGALVEALRGTMDPNLREAAERRLNEVKVNFVSALLQVTMSEQLDLDVRQTVMKSYGRKIPMSIFV